jgi:hypothetical protein
MHVDEREEGEHRILARAIEAPGGGYRAAARVLRVRGVPQPIEIFRDDHLSGGHAWDEPERALQFAIKTASSILRERARQGLASPACA